MFGALGPRRWVPALALIAVAAAAGGCGESAQPAAPRPVDYMPATASVAIEAAVRPGGELGQHARTTLAALGLSSNTVRGLGGALSTPGSPQLDYGSQVAPWLGERAGLFVTAGGRRERRLLDDLLASMLGARAGGPDVLSAGASGAVVLDARDRAAARRFVQQRASAAGAHTQQQVDGGWLAATTGGLAFASAGPIVAVGSAGAVGEVLATLHGTAPLAASSEFKTLATHAPAGALAVGFAAPGAAGELPAALRGGFALVVGDSATLLSLVPGGTSISVYAEAAGVQRGTAAGAQAREAFSTLPGESWLAAGLGGGPAALAGAAQALGVLSGPSSATTGSLLAEVSGPLRTLSGDSGAWAGPVGLFAAGNGLLELRAAAVLRANSRASAQGALAQLAAALGSQASPARVSGAERALAIHLHGLPLELVAATGTGIDGSSDLIVGAGAASVELALKPPQAMRGSPAAQAARQALGGLEPTLVVDVPTLLGTLESLQVTQEPLLKGATPYLQKVTTLDAGIGSAAPGIGRMRIVATLHA